MLAASWNAGMVIPSSRKMTLPASAKAISTPAITQHGQTRHMRDAVIPAILASLR